MILLGLRIWFVIHLGVSACVNLTLRVAGVTDASKELTALVLRAAQVNFFFVLMNNCMDIIFTRNLSLG